MKRATTFMVEHGRAPTAATSGRTCPTCRAAGARWKRAPTMIWIQPPGTATMGHLFLDAYHATGDDYYYQAAEKRGRGR